MSRPVSSQNSLTINRDSAIDQDALDGVKAFKKSLGPNDRVLVNRSGNTTIYTQHKESASEKFSRKLNNFEKNVKAAWSHVSDLLSIKNQGNGSAATKNIKDIPTQKPPGSISVKQFNLEIAPINNTCIIPVLDDRIYQPKGELNNLRSMIEKINPLDRALDLLATGPQDLEKIQKEFSAFLDFAEAQAQGKSVTHQNRDAIHFANRWVKIPTSQYMELKQWFGESYVPIFNAAFALATFASISPFDKS